MKRLLEDFWVLLLIIVCLVGVFAFPFGSTGYWCAAVGYLIGCTVNMVQSFRSFRESQRRLAALKKERDDLFDAAMKNFDPELMEDWFSARRDWVAARAAWKKDQAS